MQERPSDSELEAVRQIDTCTVTDAIATLKVRLRNQGYSDGSIRCMFERPVPMLGYAVTGRIRSAEPPVMGRRFVERSDWLRYLLTIPEPRVVVLQDADTKPGRGAFWDEVHVRIHLRLGCVGAITNGGVRDLAKTQPMGFHLHAGSVCTAQGYAHIIDMGGPVEVGGLMVNPGDLIHGDMHGFVLIPREVVAELPMAAAKVLRGRERVAELCESPDFSLEKLKGLLKELD
jgi:regulator of RNase E activity RraA